MSRSFQLDAYQQARLLREAASKRYSVVMTCRDQTGWVQLKSHFLDMDGDAEELRVAALFGEDDTRPDLAVGQNISVSFRHGHKKCVFETILLGFCHAESGPDRRIPAWRLRYPAEMSELQRRLYHRTPVPPGLRVPVNLWLDETGESRPDDGHVYAGSMLDVSVGGISVALPKGSRCGWRERQQVNCSFAVEPHEPPVQVSGLCRHKDQAADGSVRLGVQFVGLDAEREQRDTLQQVMTLAGRFQHCEHARCGRRKRVRR